MMKGKELLRLILESDMPGSRVFEEMLKRILRILSCASEATEETESHQDGSKL